MLFNSFEYLLFFPLVFIVYWFVLNKHLKFQNAFLLLASYFFYGWWDWRFLSLIIFSSIVDYTIGLQMSESDNQRKRKLLLFASLLVNLGFLGVFKYYNFFIDSFNTLLDNVGMQVNMMSLNIILPVGISFYTFQTLSYTIDIYRNKLQPTKDVLQFFTYVAFFPQLVAGPIERATNLLPQFNISRQFNYDKAVDGTKQILWGFFKKVVIADSCAPIVNDIFTNYQELSPIMLILGAILFAFQIYGDFSGYSDIAIGTSRLLGFNLMQNFAFPYFSRNMGEFWRRWHISLSTWFRDYLYIPLGGSRGTQLQSVRNIFVIFIVSGFWHGANWTFIVWGFLNALFIIPSFLSGSNRNYLGVVALGKVFPSIKEAFQIFITFLLTCLAWIFFRAANVWEAGDYIRRIFSFKSFAMEELEIAGFSDFTWFLGPLIILLQMTEWKNRSRQYGLAFISKNIIIRWGFYILIILFLIQYWGSEQDFIYFQF